jgi:two-component system KDP operon response regulator KdpE
MRASIYSYHLDEAAILQLVVQQAGFEPVLTRDVETLIESWIDRPADFVLLSFGGDSRVAVDHVERLRSQSLAPIVLIIDRLPEDIQVTLLEAGADLVIERPFNTRFLIAQIRALMRRSAGLPFFSLPILSQSGVMIDPSARTIQVDEGEIKRLTQLEFRLLFTLMTHAGRVLPTETLVEYVWGYSGEGNRGLVRGLIQRLRTKVEPDPANPKYILTEPGLGYRFDPYQEE